jgi:integrase
MRHHPLMVQHAKTYLEHRRALGFELDSHGYHLLKFAKLLDRSGHRGPLTMERIMRWVDLPKDISRNYRAIRLSAVRCFARYLAARDGRSKVPDFKLVPKKRLQPRPHIYSEHELEQLLQAAGEMSSSYKLRPLTYQTLLGLLACAGLRVSEALKLRRGHADLERGVLRIEQTKFKKSRLVPLHPTASQALQRYAAKRDKQWGYNGDAAFLVGGNGLALPYSTVSKAFRHLRNVLGWHKSNGDLPWPRIHDLRHSFACRRLLRWYQKGQNVHQLIAALSTYLGHGHVTDTYWYLTATPELLAVAGNRFERFACPVDGRRS